MILHITIDHTGYVKTEKAVIVSPLMTADKLKKELSTGMYRQHVNAGVHRYL